MRHRSGATLVEVLVAIFVTAIGLLALLALFPLGALTMAQAIKDDRTATAAANATAAAEALNIRQSPWWSDGAADDPFRQPHDIDGSAAAAPAHDDLPSYPVYVDPIGFQLLLSRGKIGLGGIPGLPRRSLRFIHKDPISGDRGPRERNQLIASWFTLLDDMTFVKDGINQGLPDSSTGNVAREGKYSWAFLLRRPRSIESKVVDLTVVVYASRPVKVELGTVRIEVLGESVYGTPERPPGQSSDTLYSNRTGKTVLSINWNVQGGQEKPQVRKGGWVLDASLESVNQPAVNGWAHGYFYRVVGIAETGMGSMDLELQTPLREDVDTITQMRADEKWWALPGPPFRLRTGRIIVLENVVEVFEKGPGWVP